MKSFRKWWKESPYGIAAVGLGGVVAMLYGMLGAVYKIEMNNRQELEDDFAHIDRVGGNVFRSLAECMAQSNEELSCRLSQETALSKTRERGLQIVYNTEADCTAKHKTCEKLTSVYFNGYTYEYPVYYKPLVVAWQAAQDDLKRAVPLYSSVKPGTGYRFDGVLVPLPDVK